MSKQQLETIETIDDNNLATAQGGAGNVGDIRPPQSPFPPTSPFPFPRPRPGDGRPCHVCGLG